MPGTTEDGREGAVSFFVARLVALLRGRVRGWRLSLVVAAVVFATSWLAMWLVEPAANEITRPGNYWWWFLVTASTVGYGDFFPESVAGHVVGAYVIVGGIVALTILFTELASTIQTAKGRRMKGVVDLDLTGHIVILGYTPGRTERIVAELSIEQRTHVALCAWEDVREHPMPEHDRVSFVRGDLASVDVLARAGVARAATVVIDARDDNEALTLAVAVDHLHPRVHLVVALRDMTRAEHLRYVNAGVACAQWHVPKLLSEEALDPGITQVYAELMSGTGSGNTYSARLPDGAPATTFGECQTLLGRRFGATLLAVHDGDELRVSPRWDTPIPAGAVLYYVAARRVEQAQLASAR